jgi:hypothetical protein
MNYKHHLYVLTLASGILLASCSEDKKTGSVYVAPKKPEVMAPFRYHERIEVSPGQDYDVLSWGRGSKAVGAFEILHSDSAAAKFTTTTGDLDGEIVDAYNSDMDLDGNPEILIRAKGKDTINYTNIYAFEFNSSGAHKLDFPKLTRSQRAGYRGDDNFYIKDGMLIREFPLYGLRGNEFTIKQLSKDSLSVKTADKQPAETATTEKKASSSSKTKKHKEETHKKKRRRHRNND